MKTTLFSRKMRHWVLVLMILLPVGVAARVNNGDVNHDGEVSLADVNEVINAILTNSNNTDADINGDGEITVADANEVINIILNGGINQHFMEVCTKAVEVDRSVTELYTECETLDEMRQHSDEIESLDDVEYVFFYDNSMFVVIKDFGTISYSFFPEPEEPIRLNSLRQKNGQMKANQAHNNNLEEDEARACIVFQMTTDEKWDVSRDLCSWVVDYFNDAGIVSKLERSLDVEFFRNGIFNYDYLFLLTHGEYEFDWFKYNTDPNYTPLYWLFTTEELPTNVIERAAFLYNIHSRYDEKDVSHGTLKEKRNGKDVSVRYLKVSDQFIGSSDRKFPHPGKAIVISAACHSMQGPGIHQVDSIDYTFATMFEQKGSGAYFGYDQTNSRGDEAGCQFYCSLLSGMSVKAAYDNLQLEVIHDLEFNDDGTKSWWADLVPYMPSQELNNSCIIKPTINYNDVSNDTELSLSLNASITCGRLDYVYAYDDDVHGGVVDYPLNNMSELLNFGFELSESQQFTSVTRLDEMRIGDDGCIWGGDSGDEFIVNFTQSLTYDGSQTDSKIKPNTTYWVRSFVYDGQGYNYSEPISFTTGSVAYVPQTETIPVGNTGLSITMVKVDGGTFTMGATEEQGTDANSLEKPAHQVTVSDYWIAQLQVTQELWVAVMGSNPSHFTGDLKLPVEYMSWNDCQTFITKLNTMTGQQFRLPTEAEWEFAARGGIHDVVSKYSGSDDVEEVAWYYFNSNSTTHPVGQKKPNELGLYDMSGNVYEWCQDWYSEYTTASQTNPTGPATGEYRIVRGGHWGSTAKGCRVSYRNGYWPTSVDCTIGLRLAMDAD